ncbi:MAG: methyltransferase [Segetibacter sp.]|nr:methyltransferase [Segetibacter sp.]
MPQIPKQFIDSLKGVEGFDKEKFLQTHVRKEAVTSVRLNPAKATSIQLPISSAVPWCNEGRYLTHRPFFTFDPLIHAGAYYVQEASSMFIDHIVRQLKNNLPASSNVLDLCAAPGGKSTLLSNALPDSFIVSNEVIKTRVTILAENISKWGSSNAMVTHNDPKDFQKLPGFFDLMVVDAPCSGSGLFRKDPTAIDEWSEANVALCSQRQQRILNDALVALQEGGYLIYSTCSYSKQEDEDVCDWIIEKFSLEPVNITVDEAWGIVEVHSDNHHVPGYRFYPHKVKGEGFFVACFRQPNATSDYYSYGASFTALTKTQRAIVEPWIKSPDELEIFKQKETIIAFPAKWKEENSVVQKTLNVRKSGVAIGTIKGKDLIPHHEFALSHLLAENVPFVEFIEADALKYLRRQDLAIEDTLKGWALARYNGLNLGWMKVLPNRVNNYYPTDWRILKP